MKTVRVSLKENAYKILIGHKSLSKIGAHLKKHHLGSNAVVITSPTIRRHHGKALVDSLKKAKINIKVLTVPDGERSKSAKYAYSLMESIARYDVMKKVFIIAFGGGVIGDLAGFVAAAYKRGVPYVQVPTTLLAQIDSAIGGKAAIDLSVGKNLVGAFYQPKLVYSDVAVLSTLSQRQIRNGLAEAVKYGIIYDRKLFDYLERHHRVILNHNIEALEKVVLSCSRIKANVVMDDEKETKGIRTILNFGHTIGHAIEASGKYSQYHHGEAIALGMRVAADISNQMGLFSQKNADRLNHVLTLIGLPEKIKKQKMSTILQIMKHDKKFLTGKNRFVLASQIGRVRIVELVPLQIIKKAIRKYLA